MPQGTTQTALSVPQVALNILDGLYDPSAVIDTEFKVRYSNSAFCSTFHVSSRQLARRSVSVFDCVLDPSGGLRKWTEHSITSKMVTRAAEVPVRTTREHAFPAWLTAIPVLDGEDRVKGTVLVIRDVSAEAGVQKRFKEVLALLQTRVENQEQIIEQRTRELMMALDKVTLLSRTDELTGLLNRRAFTEVAGRSLSLARRHHRSVALLMCDLDHFKRVNDVHGHAAGDAMLKACAATLSATVRNSDSVARFGGEEFIALLEETDYAGAHEVATRCARLIRAIDVSAVVDGMTGKQTASFGYAVYPDDASTLDELVRKADGALYTAKEMGRDRVIGTREGSSAALIERSADSERAGIVIFDLDEQRQAEYREVLGSAWAAYPVTSGKEALEICRTQTIEAFLVDDAASSLSDSGLMLCEAIKACEDAVRIRAAPSEQDLLVTTADSILFDESIVRTEIHRLPAIIQFCRDRRRVIREEGLRGEGTYWGTYLSYERRVRQVLDLRQISVAYQPIVTSDRRHVFAFEALCRLPQHASITLPILFQVAMHSGELLRLGRLIREKAVQIFASSPDSLLLLNLHPLELQHLRGNLSHEPALTTFADRIVFEITEKAPHSNLNRTREILDDIRSAGFRFAIDDLGSGYSTLLSVAYLLPEFVKVDMGIVRQVHRSKAKRAMLRSMIGLARDVGARVVAEGVETEEEAETVAAAGCELMQGFLFGVPRPLDALPDEGLSDAIPNEG